MTLLDYGSSHIYLSYFLPLSHYGKRDAELFLFVSLVVLHLLSLVRVVFQRANMASYSLRDTPSPSSRLSVDELSRERAASTATTPTVAAAAATVAVPEVDSAAFWAELHLPVPDVMPSQHLSRRVVLLGRPGSGKRTICRRLCFAAEAQYAKTEEVSEHSTTLWSDIDVDSQPLYNPGPDDDDDEELFQSKSQLPWQTSSLRSGAAAATTDAAQNQNTDTTHLLSHGSGISYTFVVQRIPHGVAALTSDAERRTTEFFCCDSAGALASALPTVRHLSEAVVLMVVDVSDLTSIRSQLDVSYQLLRTHVSSLLRVHFPNNDEVRASDLQKEQQEYWLAEEQRLLPTRVSIAMDAAQFSAAGSQDAFLVDPAASLEKIQMTGFKVPATAGTICSMRSVIVCTKVEVLYNMSNALKEATSGDKSSADYLGLPEAFRISLECSRMTLLSFMSQLLRQYAIYHCAALVAVCKRINAVTAAGTESTYAGSSLIHPFYKGFWGYLAYMLYEGDDGKPSSLPTEVLSACSARLNPHSLLPCGLDALHLLHYAVTHDGDQLPGKSSSQEGPAHGDDSPMKSRHPVQDFPVPSDGRFTLHQQYIQKATQYTTQRNDYSNSNISNTRTEDAAIVDNDDIIWESSDV